VFLAIIVVVLYFSMPFVFKLWFPYYHKEIIGFYSKQYQLDPLFVAAIIRVESNFNTNAESARGAKGLMQLMPETARWITQQIKISFEEERLFEPEYNIQLGCWYLANLRQEFNYNNNLVLAAYNGGRGNVNKWIVMGIWQGEEEGIEKIPFRETREFVKRVNLTYQIYQNLYGE